MGWKTDYPEIAKGMEMVAAKQHKFATSGKVYETLSPEETQARFKAKMEKFKETHPDIYKTFISPLEPDWGALITPRKPFGE